MDLFTLPLLVAAAAVFLAIVVSIAWLASRRREARERARLVEEWRRRLAETDLRNTEQELLRSKILEGIDEGVLAVDRRKSIALANRKLIDLFQLREPVVGTPAYQVIRNAAVHAALDDALRGLPATTVVTVRRGLEERQVDVHAMPVTGSAELAAVALFIDVTRVMRLERIRRDFITDFSHEVRTPLAGLRSAVETLEGGRIPPADEERLRGIVRRQLERLERLVDDLAELNRIESGELQLHRRPTDLAALLRDLALEFRERAATRGVAIEAEAGEVRADVDPQRVQQIVSNLLDNAIKFSPSGGVVRLEAARRDGRAVITVEDAGEGIPPEEQDRIFHRFYRVDKSRSQDVPGTGLGLAIVKHLTALHGGFVEVESAPGRGARFRVVLPGAE